jgi:hypothetical protein
MRTKLFVSLSIVTLSIVASPAVASAGEVTGTGESTGMRDHARSVCGFSGLEDIAESPLRTQTPHEVWFDAEVGVINPPHGAPGVACNPTRAGG